MDDGLAADGEQDERRRGVPANALPSRTRSASNSLRRDGGTRRRPPERAARAEPTPRRSPREPSARARRARRAAVERGVGALDGRCDRERGMRRHRRGRAHSGKPGSTATRRRRSGARSSAISSSSRRASAGSSAARTAAAAAIETSIRCDVPGRRRVTAARATSTSSTREDDRPVRVGGAAVGDLQQHVEARRIVGTPTRRQALEADVADRPADLDHAIGPPVAGPRRESPDRRRRSRATAVRSAAEQCGGRRGRLLAAGAGEHGGGRRLVERAERVPRVGERSHVDVGAGSSASSARARARPAASRDGGSVARQHAERVVDPHGHA
jgi:hypothetical protein